MRVGITDLQSHVKIDKKGIRKKVESLLKNMGEGKSELSLVFVTDSCIRKLNRRYRNIDSKTDVLAFSMREGRGLSRKSPVLGDVVVSTETAKREANKRDISVHKEITLYIVHGILHLLGYKDKTVTNRKKMKRKELELLEAM